MRKKINRFKNDIVRNEIKVFTLIDKKKLDNKWLTGITNMLNMSVDRKTGERETKKHCHGFKIIQIEI